jgi:hypothetical protein
LRRALYGFLFIWLLWLVLHGSCRGARWFSCAYGGTAPANLRSRRQRATKEPVPPLRRPARAAGAGGRRSDRRPKSAGAEATELERRGCGRSRWDGGRAAAGSCSAIGGAPGVGELRPRSGATSTLYRLVHGPLPRGGAQRRL